MKSIHRPKATSEAILDAAIEIASEKGWPAVTIRAVADRLGYASPLLYEHFRNKDDLFAAVARLGFEKLEASLSGVESSVGSDRRIVEIGKIYVEFARREPALYRVMHGLDGAVTDPAAIAAGAESVCTLAADEISRWALAQGVPMPDPVGETEILWCLLHGIASLSLTERLGTESDRRTEASIRLLLEGWRSR